MHRINAIAHSKICVDVQFVTYFCTCELGNATACRKISAHGLWKNVHCAAYTATARL